MATILIVDDDMALRESLVETVSDLGHRAIAVASGTQALGHLSSETVHAVVLDLHMPGKMDGLEVLRRIQKQPQAPPVAVLTAFASAENTIEAMRLGAFDHLTKPIGRAEIEKILTRMVSLRDTSPGAVAELQESTDTLIGASEAMRRVQKTIGLAADSNATVLVLGETGTGKELVAQALHKHSRRKDKPFVAVNCAAIPGELLESELFGHVKGAFTGAGADRAGAFRTAHDGTLFLDEIGDMPATMQAKILRVLQDRVVTPVGGKSATVDVRVVAATHRDLPNLVSEGAFREDLFYRLNVVTISLPPLRERLADIVPLAEHFLRLASRERPAKQLIASAASKLIHHAWPGNVRELRNVIERASVLVRGNAIDAGDLSIPDRESDRARLIPSDWLEGDLPTAVANLEKTMITHALEACGGHRAEAARRLDINRQLLYTKMQRYGLSEEAMSANPTSAVKKSDD